MECVAWGSLYFSRRFTMNTQPNGSSKTMRIDIPPDLRDELQRTGRRPPGAVPSAEPVHPPRESATPAVRVGGADFQQLFHSVYDGAVIAETNGRIVDSNSRAQDFLKQTREELCAMSITDVISGANAATLATLISTLDKDRFVLIQAYCNRKDGRIFPTEIAVNRLTVHGVQYLCMFIRDITWRRQAEDMLRTVHNAIQNTPTGIAIANRDTQIEYVNNAAARLWGRERREDLIGREVRSLFPEPAVAEAMIKAVSGGNSWTGEITVARPDGSTVAVQVVAAANRNTEDELSGMVLSFLDISDRRRAEQAERQAERQRVMVESLGAACHHLGQPATVLLASLELMTRMPSQDRAVTEELLSSSMEAAESLREMLHELNDMTESEYRTTAYLESGKDSGVDAPRILDVRSNHVP